MKMKLFFLALTAMFTLYSCGGSKASVNSALPSTTVSSSKEITAFSIADSAGIFSGDNISVTLPFGSLVTALTPSITYNGSSISPAIGAARDFTNPVIYTVTAEDLSTRTYTVDVQAVQPWTRLMGGTGGTNPKTVGHAITSDLDGNTYVSGSTMATTFDGQATPGATSSFTIKYDQNGVKQWSTLLGNTGHMTVSNGVASDADGSIYITGKTDGNFHNNIQDVDAFVTKYNSNGVQQWTSLINVAGPNPKTTTEALAVTTDVDGNIYITGYTNAALDGLPLPTSTNAMFVSKFSTSGALIWSKLLRGSGGSLPIIMGNGIVADSDDNVYITGMTMMNLEVGQPLITGTSTDSFVVKYDKYGSYQWISNMLGVQGPLLGATQSNAITLDANKNIYITGYTTGPLDGQTFVGGYSTFVTKYNPTGTKQWTKLLLGSNAADVTEAFAITSDYSGHIYITGTTNGNIDNQIKTGVRDVFVSKYNANDGTRLGTRLMGTTNVTANGNGMTNVRGSGNICVAGDTTGPLDGQTFIGSQDVFVTTDLNF